MRISIVTAVLNRRDTIRCALESLSAQTYSDVEHLIQDGGSTDGTLDVIAKWKFGDVHLNSRPDLGIYDALNLGISRATGDVIGLLHSDDVFASAEVLSKVAVAFANPSIDGVYGDLEYFDKDDATRVIRYWKSGHFVPGMLRKGWMPAHPTLFLRRSIFSEYGLYDTSFNISADYEAILRWFKRSELNFSYLPQLMVRMRLGGESNRSLRHMLRKSREDWRAIRFHGVGGIEVLLAKNLRKLPQFFQH